MNKIAHISTVHPRRDTRIFYRECLSLIKEGFEVVFIVADGLGNENYKGVDIIDLGKSKNRLINFTTTYFKILKLIRKLNPQLVHFHDAELMIVGKRLSMKGISVFYDIHENVAVQILDKTHIPSYLRKPFSYVYKRVESTLINNFHLILAETSYTKVYQKKGKSISVVLNLPETNTFNDYIVENRLENGIFYIGGISNDRGLDVILDALRILKRKEINFFMHYIGEIPKTIEKEINTDNINNNIKFYGRMDLIEGYALSKHCKVGLAVLKPIKNYLESYPTKIFEYMSIKLPVITSNFKIYKKVVETYDSGYCIDPNSSVELAEKIELLLKDSTLVKNKGANGYKAVREKYNWNREEKKIFKAYYKALNEF